MRPMLPEDEMWELTPVYKDGTEGKTIKVKGLGQSLSREEKIMRNRNVRFVKSKLIN